MWIEVATARLARWEGDLHRGFYILDREMDSILERDGHIVDVKAQWMWEVMSRTISVCIFFMRFFNKLKG